MENRDLQSSVSLNGIEFKHAEIFAVVDDFYKKVAMDPLLKVPFASVHDWPEHIERLTHFWWIKFGGQAYMWSQYNPVAKHYHAGFNKEFLTRWLELFHSVLAHHLNEDQSRLWRAISSRMGEALSIKNEMFGQAVEAAKNQNEDGP